MLSWLYKTPKFRILIFRLVILATTKLHPDVGKLAGAKQRKNTQ